MPEFITAFTRKKYTRAPGDRQNGPVARRPAEIGDLAILAVLRTINRELQNRADGAGRKKTQLSRA
jgi:hypothetical protein